MMREYAAKFVTPEQAAELAVKDGDWVSYGYYSGSPMYCAFNFATGFNSAAYDYAFNMTIDPGMYDDYSQYYIKDAADIFMLK